jgi:hypothetical protein
MPNLGLDTIPKEVFLLVGAVLGFVGAMITTLINSRTQLKLTRETHQQQQKLARETHQHQHGIETLKLQAQAKQEAQVNLRSKMEEAHQILSKIATENSQTASYIMWDRGLTAAEYHAQYQQQQVDVQRLEMIVALYFPKLQDVIDDLPELMNQFWGYQHLMIHRDAKRLEAKEELHNGADPTMETLLDLVRKIHDRVSVAQNRLRTMVSDVLPPLAKE